MITKGMLTSNKDNWTTPKKLFNELNNKFHFTLDACADDENHLCEKYYTKENSCLEHSFKNEIVFMNPPYGRYIIYFIQHAFVEAFKNKTKIVMLLPARTDTKWFHDLIYTQKIARIEFIKGRLHFNDEKNAAPFPSMIVYYNC